VPQPFLKAGKNRLLVAALEIDDAIGFQARLRQRRREKVGPGDAPHHLALGSGRNPAPNSAAAALSMALICSP
jgi:hypothetical protein